METHDAINVSRMQLFDFMHWMSAAIDTMKTLLQLFLRCIKQQIDNSMNITNV